MIYTVTLNPALDRELTVSEIIFDDVLRATQSRIDYGGKGFNVSRALAALGMESTALGFVGGSTGQKITQGLQALGIKTNFVTIAGETRTNVSLVSQSAAHHIKVNEAGPIISLVEQNKLLETVKQLVQTDDWWVLAGSLPPDMSLHIYADMIKIIQAAGGRVILDTSGEALRYGCQAKPFLIKPNVVEASQLSGLSLTNPDDAEAALQAIHQLGVSQVLISFGKAGALLSTEENRWLGHPATIQECNPIGAGDAMVGGVVWALSQNYALPEVLRWGMACGAAAASLEGTTMGSHALVESLAQAVEITAL